jgi:hypothetical protein
MIAALPEEARAGGAFEAQPTNDLAPRHGKDPGDWVGPVQEDFTSIAHSRHARKQQPHFPGNLKCESMGMEIMLPLNDKAVNKGSVGQSFTAPPGPSGKSDSELQAGLGLGVSGISGAGSDMLPPGPSDLKSDSEFQATPHSCDESSMGESFTERRPKPGNHHGLSGGRP